MTDLLLSLYLFLSLRGGTGGVRRALQEPRRDEAGQRGGAEKGKRLGSGECGGGAEEIVDATLAQTDRRLLEGARRVINGFRHLGQFGLQLACRGMDDVGDLADLVRSGSFLILGEVLGRPF